MRGLSEASTEGATASPGIQALFAIPSDPGSDSGSVQVCRVLGVFGLFADDQYGPLLAEVVLNQVSVTVGVRQGPPDKRPERIWQCVQEILGRPCGEHFDIGRVQLLNSGAKFHGGTFFDCFLYIGRRFAGEERSPRSEATS